MESDGEDELSKPEKKAAKSKKNAAGDYVITKIVIDDNPILKKVKTKGTKERWESLEEPNFQTMMTTN